LSATKGFSTATDLADYIVKKGLAFRDAHEIVGKTVAYAIREGIDLAEIPLDKLSEFSPLIEDDVFKVLTLEGSVNARNHFGGTAPNQVLESIKTARSNLEIR
jgi:argininosuccinate lyase